MAKRNAARDTSLKDVNDARQSLIDAGLRTATREEWIELTGQDPLDPSTWNNTAFGRR